MVGVLCTSTMGQTTSPGPKAQQGSGDKPRVLLSEIEQLTLENLKLKDQLLHAQVQLATLEFQNSLAKFANDTIKAHGGRIRFNVDTMTFVVMSDEKKEK